MLLTSWHAVWQNQCYRIGDLPESEWTMPGQSRWGYQRFVLLLRLPPRGRSPA
ncbi:hypothetical protein [Leptothermofonsia sp. ETS-13]|uniref:hypothetical protein n=1 Tax=Leptothermofonsia sp. ETS-13 TaxID=3035696 RepID=UPI003BA09F6D